MGRDLRRSVLYFFMSDLVFVKRVYNVVVVLPTYMFVTGGAGDEVN